MKPLRYILPLVALLSMTACELRPLYTEGETPVDVLVCMDWTQLGSNPTGATIMFYPEGGGSPYTFQTNSVARTTVQVPSGYYTVLIFNRTVDEFGTMSFGQMESLGTAKCILYEKVFSWLGRSEEVGRTVYEPEEIVSGRTDHFYVRTMGERKVTSWDEGQTKAADSDSDNSATVEVDSVMVTSKRMVFTGNISVRVKGINNVKSVRSYLTGMAGGSYLATRSATDTLATHVLESWTVTTDATDYTSGYLTTSFSCLGLPEQYKQSSDSLNNHLKLKILLVDNQTIVESDFSVGDRIYEIEEQLSVNLTIGVGATQSDTAIVLPDVKPEGGSASGFDVTIDDWEDGESVVVPL